MFDLEQSIASWRRQMLTAGIKSPAPLEELDIHLREDIERQMKSGLNAQEAFGIAVKKIGQALELKREFKKVSAPMEMQKVIKLAGVILVAVALFCPLFMFLPCLQAHELSLMTRTVALAVYAITVATIVISWKYNHKLLPVIHNQPLRRAVGVACYGGCLLWIRFGIFHFSPGGSHPRSLLPPLLIFGLEWTVMAILGGAGHGLEKAALKKTAMAAS
ncbi:MAG: permease prefix domain 1-containing protein [Verrucomicrobiia bacterium]